jgi:hypothetical protein
VRADGATYALELVASTSKSSPEAPDRIPTTAVLAVMRKQYSFWPWPTDDATNAWDVDRLVTLAREVPATQVPLDAIWQVDRPYWGTALTPRHLAVHTQLVLDADLSYPIILAADGRVMDGMHRVVKAILSGQLTIAATQLRVTPEPDFRNCRPEDLPYEEGPS